MGGDLGPIKISCSSSAGNSERFLALLVVGGGKFFRNFSTIPIVLESILSPSSSFLVTSFRPLILSSFVSDMLKDVISETQTFVNNKILDSTAGDSTVDICQTLSGQRTP